MHLNKVLVCSAGGIIGGHLIKRLKKKEVFWVSGVDIKNQKYTAIFQLLICNLIYN